MMSKERIRAAPALKETDRVPTTMQCVETAWDNLKEHLGLETKEDIMQERRTSGKYLRTL